ncbi:MBL fold metallo-hydrolase [Inhella sp.]|uniref:MBL fold metallo-hydrolase n=1 Tax=Inhella sp. TaxID=1921806 RepID=UPI0035B22DBD
MQAKTLITSALASSISLAATAQPLQLQVYNAPAGSFHANAVLVSGEKDAVLLDTGFTRADALRIAALVLDSGKQFKTIYISQADPDFYFGAALLQQLFPQARLVSTAATRQKIGATLATKLQVWGPRLGANAPQTVPLPEVLAGDVIELEGERLELRGLDDALPLRS